MLQTVTHPAPSVPRQAVASQGWRSWVHGLERDAAFVGFGLLGIAFGLVADGLAWPTWMAWLAWAAAFGFGGWHGLVAGLQSLRHGEIDIDLLMILAALGALAIGAPFEGALLLFLFSLSEVLQAIALGRSRRAIEALMDLRPETARVRRDGRAVETPLDEIVVGDVYEVRPGDRLPLDGTIAEGRAALDEASLTGESVPVTKEVGADVFGGTINTDGHLAVRVTKRADESALARMIALVEEAQDAKAETQRLLDRFESPYAIAILALTALAVAIPMLGWDAEFEPTFYRAMTLLVAASPCALVISTPAAVLSAIASGARRGVLFKGGIYVEQLATLKAVAFDKTGTLTEGRTRLTGLAVFDGANVTEDDLLRRAAAVQAHSEHHLARATVEAARVRNLDVPGAEDFQATVGQGVAATVEGVRVHIGNARYFSGEDGAYDAARQQVAAFEANAQTGVIVAEERGGRRVPLGAFAFADTMRSAAPGVVRALKEAGIDHVAMLTGDNAGVAEHIAAKVGHIDAVHAGLLPERKVTLVSEIQARYGRPSLRCALRRPRYRQ
ncbi:MAG: heavy metal translocating P-type ATPase, partial [Bacteroidota bacterium]